MLSQKMQDALNAQINAEFWSAYLYLSMSAYANAQGYPGMAHWFEVQYQEELDHVKIFFDYILQRDGRVMLDPIQGVPTEWANPLDLFQNTLKHEQTVTGLINTLYSTIDSLKMIGDNGYGIYTLDKDLATRVYTQAAPLAAKNA